MDKNNIIPGGFQRGFIHRKASWYAQSLPRGTTGDEDEVMVGLYDGHGSTLGEFAVRWYPLDAGPATPRLEIFEDAWAKLEYFQDFFQALSSAENATPEKICAILSGLGVRDMTERNAPRPHRRTP